MTGNRNTIYVDLKRLSEFTSYRCKRFWVHFYCFFSDKCDERLVTAACRMAEDQIFMITDLAARSLSSNSYFFRLSLLFTPTFQTIKCRLLCQISVKWYVNTVYMYINSGAATDLKWFYHSKLLLKCHICNTYTVKPLHHGHVYSSWLTASSFSSYI